MIMILHTLLHNVTQEELRVVITNSPSNSCELYPLTTNLLKKVQECLLPLITTVINKSLVEFDVSPYFKKMFHH